MPINSEERLQGCVDIMINVVCCIAYKFDSCICTCMFVRVVFACCICVCRGGFSVFRYFEASNRCHSHNYIAHSYVCAVYVCVCCVRASRVCARMRVCVCVHACV